MKHKFCAVMERCADRYPFSKAREQCQLSVGHSGKHEWHGAEGVIKWLFDTDCFKKRLFR